MLAVALVMVGPSVRAYGAGLEVTNVASRVTNNIYVVDADISYGLSEDMRNALNNGIPLAFDVEVEVHRPRPYIWNVLMVRTVQRLTLEFHALSGTYVVSNNTIQTRRSFPTLEEALEDMGRMRNLAVSETRHLPDGGNYIGRMRVSLDVEALPPPLRPIAYLSRDWHRHSPWRQWKVNS